MSRDTATGGETAWYLVDHDQDDTTVRGPYPDSTTAGAVRREMEREGYFSEHGNLWIVPREVPA